MSMPQLLPMDANQQRIPGRVNSTVQEGDAITSEMSKVSNFQQKFVLMGGQSQQIAPWLSHLSPAIGMPTSSAGTVSTAIMSTGQQVVLARDASTAMEMETNGSLASGLAISEAYTVYGEEYMSSTVQSSNNEGGSDLGKKSQASSEAMALSKPPDAPDALTHKTKPTSLDDIFADIKSIVESKDEEMKKLVDIQLELFHENRTLRSMALSLREELQWKNDLVTELERKVERLEDQIAKLHVKKSLLTQQLDKYRSDLCTRKKKISGLKGAVEMAQKALHDFEASEKVDDTEEMDEDEVMVVEVIPFKGNEAAQREAPLKLDDVGPEAAQPKEIQPKPNAVTVYTIKPSGNVEPRDALEEKNSLDAAAATSDAARAAFAAELGLKTQASAPRAKRAFTVFKPAKTYACNRCDRRFYNRSTLVEHKNFDCGKPRISCERCQRSLRPRSYQQHLQLCVCVAKAKA